MSLFPDYRNIVVLFIFSKRSQSADHSLNDRLSRDKAELARQIRLLQILKTVDTSGQLPATMAQPDVSDTSTTVLNNLVEPDSRSRKRKNRQRKNGKGRNGKKRGNKQGRTQRRRRSRSAVAHDIVNLLESVHGEEILRAIVGALDDDYEYTDNVHDLEKFVRSSSKKCKCRLSRKNKS